MLDFSLLDVVAVGISLIALWVARKAYHRVDEIKALDLRLELRKAVSDARAILDGLPGLMKEANRSRQNILADRGLMGGEIMTAWSTSFDADSKEVVTLNDELPGSDNDYAAMTNHSQLESSLVSIHRLSGRAYQLQKKYEEALDQDDKLRDRSAVERAPWVLKH